MKKAAAWILAIATLLGSGAFAYHRHKVSEFDAALTRHIGNVGAMLGQGNPSQARIGYEWLEYRFPYDAAILHGATLSHGSQSLALRRIKISDLAIAELDRAQYLASASFRLVPDAPLDMGSTITPFLQGLGQANGIADPGSSAATLEGIALLMPSKLDTGMPGWLETLDLLFLLGAHLSSGDSASSGDWFILLSHHYAPDTQTLELRIQASLENAGTGELSLEAQGFKESWIADPATIKAMTLLGSISLQRFSMGFEDLGLYSALLDSLASIHGRSREELLEILGKRWSVKEREWLRQLDGASPSAQQSVQDALEQAYAFLTALQPKISLHLNPPTPLFTIDLITLATHWQRSGAQSLDEALHQLGFSLKAE